MGKKVIIISGVNLLDGGPISVYHDFLHALIENKYYKEYKIIALVGNKELFKEFSKHIHFIEYKKSKKSWIIRLYLEYFGFKKISKRLDVDIWISMHDTTPNVIAKHKYVYCHNPSPFNKMKIKETKFGLKYYLFSKFYKYLYKINIKKNDAIIVQQDWMRQEFKKIYHINNIIVARPSMPENLEIKDTSNEEHDCIFIFPSFPRYYKNFQIACEAALKLEQYNISNFKIYITLDGKENNYSRFIKSNYKHCSKITFVGLVSREELFKLYGQSKCLLFMSKLETWGMPITEYKQTNKTIIVSDLPYAHETVGNYENVLFIDPNDSEALANAMKLVIQKKSIKTDCVYHTVEEPYANDWNQLLNKIFNICGE